MRVIAVPDLVVDKILLATGSSSKSKFLGHFSDFIKIKKIGTVIEPFPTMFGLYYSPSDEVHFFWF